MDVDQNGAASAKLRAAMLRCTPSERRFIDHVLRGESHESAALSAGYRSRLAAQDLLGRPRVADALQRAASYLPAAEAYRCLRPLLTAKLVSTALAGGAAGISAGRDLQAMAKGEDKGVDLLKQWQERRAARKLATRDAGEVARGASVELAPTIPVRDEALDS